MGHSISGLVGSPATLTTISGMLECDGFVRNSDGWGFLPLSDSDLDRILPLPQDFLSGDFLYVSSQLIKLVRELSAHGALAYVETEYFGGIGTQSAFAFRNGSEVCPPTSSCDAINDALSAIGVDFTKTGRDEFESVGLHRIRSNEDARDTIRGNNGCRDDADMS